MENNHMHLELHRPLSKAFRLQQLLLRWQPLRLRLHLLQKPKQLLRLASL